MEQPYGGRILRRDRRLQRPRQRAPAARGRRRLHLHRPVEPPPPPFAPPDAPLLLCRCRRCRRSRPTAGVRPASPLGWRRRARALRGWRLAAREPLDGPRGARRCCRSASRAA